MDYESLIKINPNLIYCSITGFGQDGQYAKRLGYEAAFQGMSGMTAVIGNPEDDPQRVGDHRRDERPLCRSGDHGSSESPRCRSWWDFALLDVGLAAMAPRSIQWTEVKIPEGLGTKSPGSAPAQVLACADGYLNIQAGSEVFLLQASDALGLGELKEDQRLAIREDRVINQLSLFEEQSRQRSTKELFDDLAGRWVMVAQSIARTMLSGSPRFCIGSCFLKHPILR